MARKRELIDTGKDKRYVRRKVCLTTKGGRSNRVRLNPRQFDHLRSGTRGAS